MEATQTVAEDFMYSGPAGMFLSRARLALGSSATPYTVSFLHGTDPANATSLESWTFAHPSDGIVSLASLTNPALVVGDTYFVKAMNPGGGTWNENDSGEKGLYFTFGVATPPYFHDTITPRGAFDVTVSSTGSLSTPEPASIALMFTGLAGLSIPAVRRRRKAAVVA